MMRLITSHSCIDIWEAWRILGIREQAHGGCIKAEDLQGCIRL
jgi:hypothetical protein